jgi:mannose-6-phosphate isomerase-like protein (cupin superfamily)
MNKPIQVIDVQEKLQKFDDLWAPKIIAELNDSYIKLAKFKGEYVWHKHDNEDEMFWVISGNLIIELRDQTLSLKPGQMVVIPKGIEHKPVALKESQVMLIELKTTISTGDTEDTQDKESTSGQRI